MHARDNQPMSLIMLDLDDFKIINDQHGHAAGDEVLILLANLVRSRIRETDYFYRYGGDEFMILANHSDLRTTEILAEDIRLLIYQAALIEHKPISVSMGVSEYMAGESADEWLILADKAMYAVKRSGKNGVSTLSKELPLGCQKIDNIGL
jgi:diguanylate cyclase (GGDEF)-like protein